jgi:cell division protein FtsQ
LQRGLSLLFIFILIAGIGYALLSLPIWDIQNVEVQGTKILSADEIKSLAGIPLTGNLFFSNLKQAHINLKKISAIKEFHIRRIPPGSIIIYITERKPISIIIYKNTSSIIDQDGFVLNKNPNLSLNISNLADLPVISGISSMEMDQGGMINPKVAMLISNIITDLASTLGSKRIQLDIGNFEKIKFMLDDILLVFLGTDENISQKMAVFKKLLPIVENKWAQVEYIDIRFPQNPVIKYK